MTVSERLWAGGLGRGVCRLGLLGVTVDHGVADPNVEKFRPTVWS